MSEVKSIKKESQESIIRSRKRTKTSRDTIDREARRTQEREIAEKIKRAQMLNNVVNLFKRVRNKRLREIKKEQELLEWQRYTNCNRMPYPEIPKSVRGHFLCWCQEAKYAKLEDVDIYLSMYLPLFDIIRQLEDVPLKPYTSLVQILREVVVEWKNEFIERIDYACFLLIKEIERYFKHIDFYTRDYHLDMNMLKVDMWCLMNVPMRSDYTRDTPVIAFEDNIVTLPTSYSLKPIIVRVMKTDFDLFSDSTRSKYCPQYVRASDLLEEVQRCEELKDAIKQELLDIEKRKEKFQSTQSTAQSTVNSDDSQQSDFSSADRLDRFSARFSTKFSVWSRRSSDVSNVSGITTRKSTVMWQSSESSREEGTRRRAPWERRGSQTFSYAMSKGSVATTATARMRHSHIFQGSLDHTMEDDFEKLLVQTHLDTLDRWSCPDLELLAWKDSEENFRNSLTFVDLIFSFDKYKYDPESKNIQELMKDFGEQSVELMASVSSKVKSFLEREEEHYQKMVDAMKIESEPFEVNLRKYHTFSGILYIDIIVHAEEFCRLKNGDVVQVQFGPYQIQRDNFFVKKPKEENFEFEYYFDREFQEEEESEEAEEEELLEVEGSENDSKIQDMVTVRMKLREDCFWFMKPLPAVWDNEKKMWSFEHVYKVSHERTLHELVFDLGKVGPVALFTYRFHELPFKDWSLVPSEEENSAIFTLFGQHLTLEFKIVDDKVCLEKLEGCSMGEMDTGLFALDELVYYLRSLGLDVFPEDDSFLYVDGVRAKPLALEDHTYFSIAMYSTILEFTSSSWNLAFGQNELAFRCRLHSPYNPLSYRTIRADNFRCELLKIDDAADTYQHVVVKEVGFLPDVYSMLSKFYAKNVHLSQSDLPRLYTVYRILAKTKVLTFSGSTSKSL